MADTQTAFERRRGNIELICQELMMDESTSASPKMQAAKRPRQKKKKCKTATTEALICNHYESVSLKENAETCLVCTVAALSYLRLCYICVSVV